MISVSLGLWYFGGRVNQLAKTRKDSEYLYTASDPSHGFTAYIGSKDGNTPTVKTDFRTGSAEFILTGLPEKISKPSRLGNQVTFKNIYPETDVEYEMLSNGIKENIILKKPTGNNKFDFILKTHDIKAKNITQNSYGTTFYNDKDQYLFHFLKPFAVDAKGTRTELAYYLIQPTDDQSTFFVSLFVNSDWLNDPARKYPITVDPTVVYNTSSPFADGIMNRVYDTIDESLMTSATGGTITESGGYTIHTFTGNDTFTANGVGNVEVLVVAGGGGGGSSLASHGGAGGGGAGGVLYNAVYQVSSSPITVTVGNGGAGGAINAGVAGTNGQNSTFGSIVATGGGGGGEGNGNNASPGSNGGSGGGAGYYGYAGSTVGTGVAGQGFNGGQNGATSGAGGGGGGGAGEAGKAPTNSPLHNGGLGGNGRQYNISGIPTYYGGGGGGGGGGGNGGLGGGGNNGQDGTANTGGGGGASYAQSSKGGNGGSGIVIVRYPTGGYTSFTTLQTFYQKLAADEHTLALWHLDETSGTTVSDSSGNNYHGTSSQSDIAVGRIDKGRNFNGSSSYIEIANSGSIPITNEFTLESWVYRNVDANNYERIISKSDATAYDLYFQISNTDLLTCGLVKADGGSVYLDSVNPVPSGKWTHVTCTYDTNHGYQLYIDGVLDRNGYAGTAPGPLRSSARNIQIGRLGSGSFSYSFTGTIDEVRISNIARSAEEIKLSANRRPYSIFTSDLMSVAATAWNPFQWTELGARTGDGEILKSGTGLIAQWDFNETSGTTASNNTASAPPTSYTATGGVITEVGGYRIHTFTEAGIFTPNQDMSVEYLVVGGGGSGSTGSNYGGGGGAGQVVTGNLSVTSSTNYSVTIGAGGTGGGNNATNSSFDSIIALKGNPGVAQVGGNSGGNYTGGANGGGAAGGGGAGSSANGQASSGATGGAGGAGTTSNISGSSVVYAGGGGGAHTDAGGGGLGTGGGGNGGSNSAHLTGYNASANTGGGGGGAVNSTAGSGGSGVVIVRYPLTGENDSCGSFCNGTLTNFASTSSQDQAVNTGWTANNKRWGAGALMFDKVDDYVITTYHADQNPSGLSISVEAWVNPRNLTALDRIAGNAASNTGWRLRLASTSANSLEFYIGDGAAYHTCILPHRMKAGNWYYVVGTYDGSKFKLYVNGVNLGSCTDAFTPNWGTTAIVIGGAPEYWGGIIDSIRIYNRALPDGEILSNYNAADLEVQTRVGNTVNPNDGTWEPWKSVTAESLIDSLDDTSNWFIDNDILYEQHLVLNKAVDTSNGNGSDGACSVTGTDTNINTASCSGRGTADGVNFSVTENTAKGANAVTLSATPTGLSVGDEFIIINLQGTLVDHVNVGQYETHRITGINGNTLSFTDSPLKYGYNGTTQKIMVQRVPNYTDVTVGRVASGKNGSDANNAGYSCLDLKNSGVNADGNYYLDPDGLGGNAPFMATCNMTRDGGGWMLALKPWYQSGLTGVGAGAIGSLTDANSLKGTAFKFPDSTIRQVIGASQNFDVMGDQNGFNSAYSTGNYEYVILRNYTAYWQFTTGMPESTTETVFQSYRISNNALLSTFNLKCGVNGMAGINCISLLSADNPGGGAYCASQLGSSVNSSWHHFFMSQYNSDTYLYICNGAQHSSGQNMNHRFWIRERKPASLTASAWDGTKGGLVAFRSNGTLTVNTNGSIAAGGLGYRGGASLGASWSTYHGYNGESYAGIGTRNPGGTMTENFGGGAGGGLSTGGAGGGYGSAGSRGISSHESHQVYVGMPGRPYGDAPLSRLYLGSGGGGGGDGYAGAWGQTNAAKGNGGSGGGIIFIGAETVSTLGNGTISATGAGGGAGWMNGEVAGWIAGGAGGGGAGGSAKIMATSVSLPEKENLMADGGKSASPYYGLYGNVNGGYVINPFGGDGGAGRIAIYHSGSLTGNSYPPAYTQKLPLSNFKTEGTASLKIDPTYTIDGLIGLWHFGENSSKKVYSCNNSDQTYTVPAGVTSINVKMWGAGGGAGNLGGWTYGSNGGGGGYTSGDIAVTPGQQLTIVAGCGGSQGATAQTTPTYGGGGRNCNTGTDCRYGGAGGGRSAIRYNDADLLTAGGGGGGGSSRVVYTMSGGAGGGLTGATGRSLNLAGGGGSGGSQSEGGIAGVGANASGTAGTQYQGGNPASNSYGGGGGGGYFGGGGGGYQEANWMGGGGGGAGYIAGTGVSNAVTMEGNDRIQANKNDPDNGGAGAGGLGGFYTLHGMPGKVIITPNVSTGGAPYQEYDSSGKNNHGTLANLTESALVDGITGKGLKINGGYLKIPSILTSANTNLSQEFWVYVASASQACQFTQIGKGIGVGVGSASYDNSSGNFGNKLIILLESIRWVDTGVTIGTGWHHIALTIDQRGYVEPYIDGRSLGTFTGTAPNIDLYSHSSYVGGSGGRACSQNNIVDEFKVYDKKRTPDQVAESYRMGLDHRVGKTISSTDLSAKDTLSFYVASDRPGTYLESIIGESSFGNNEPDLNTKALLRFDEINGLGPYLKDSSGNHNNGAVAAAVSHPGKFGNARFFDGAADYVTLGSPASLDFGNNGPFTISGWIYPRALVDYTSFVSKNANRASTYTFMTVIHANGRLAIMNNTTWLDICPAGSVKAGQWQHIAYAYNGTNLTGYVNGTACGSIAFAYTDNAAHTIDIGSWQAASTSYDFNGYIDEVSISNVARTAEEIRQAAQIDKRTHTITIDFAANLDSGNLITDSGDTAFTIDATGYGIPSKGGNLYLGDTVIIREVIDSQEYLAQGVVSTNNTSTGAVTVTSWIAGSTFPPAGFSNRASVFKWQREIFDLKGSLSTDRNAITKLSFRQIGNTGGHLLWIDELKSNVNAMSSPEGSTIESSLGKQYFQYRIIGTTNDYNVSAGVTSVTTDFQSLAPTAPTIGSAIDLSPTQVRWNFTDNSTDETGFKIIDDLTKLSVATGSAGAAYIDEANLTPNTLYTRRVISHNANGYSLFSDKISHYTLAAVPPAPLVSDRAATTAIVDLESGTNPANTLMAIYKSEGIECTGAGGSYLAADGSSSVTEVWQTESVWSALTATGLDINKSYVFCVKAKNGVDIETQFSDKAAHNLGYIPASGDYIFTTDTIDSSSFITRYPDGNIPDRFVLGVDNGNPSNNAKFEVKSGILTINSTDTLVVGSLEMTGGTVAIADGGEIKVGSPIWYIDADGDGYSADRKLYIGNAPGNGRRKNTTNTMGTMDCKDDFYKLNNLCYITATGGNSVTVSGGYKYHTFTGNGTLNITDLGYDNDLEYMVVAGGGGGGGSFRGFGGGGGGGGGGMREGSFVASVTSYSATIGGGGAGGPGNPCTVGSVGGNSTFYNITSTGGGGGGNCGNGGAGTNGGSGGGAGGALSYNSPGTGIAGQGFNGGPGQNTGSQWGGGGGGAGGAGVLAGAGPNKTSTVNGGAYAGGGVPGYKNGYHHGAAGGANTGRGGGGGANYHDNSDPDNVITFHANGGNGGSGIVVVRYLYEPQ